MTHPRDASPTVRASGRSTRVATYASGPEYESVARQEASMRSFLATRPEWALTASYLDVRPRRRGQRIQLRRALTDAMQGRFDVLLIHNTSRLTRDLRELSAIIGDLDACGVALFSTTELFDTATPIGRFTAQLLAAVAAYEAARSGPDGATPAARRARPHRSQRRHQRSCRVCPDRRDGANPDG
jgi:DNA invertase Pin-like site-specific DNA recombinase